LRLARLMKSLITREQIVISPSPTTTSAT
jgi:hypothetical protein